MPQTDVLSHVDLVAHHAGSATSLAAFGLAIPQLVVPRGADQFVNAEAIDHTGASLRLTAEGLTPEAVSRATSELLADERYRLAAAGIATEIATMPSPDDVGSSVIDEVRGCSL